MKPFLISLLTMLAIAPAAFPVTAAPAEDAPPAADALAVEYVDVELAEDIVQMSLTGTIEAQEAVSAGFREGGRVIEVSVSEGEAVLRGQPLARIDRLQQEQALRVAEAALIAATAQEAVARQSAERAGTMLERGIGTRAAHDAAVEGLTAAQTAVEQAHTQVELARRMLADTTITAPFDGVVTQRMADPGQIVGPAQPLIRIARMDSLRAVFQIPDDPRLAEAMGAEVSLQPIDHPDTILTGRVTEIAPLVGPTTGSVEMWATIIAGDLDAGRLGAPVRGSLAFRAGREIWLPSSALVRKGAGAAVWVIGADDRASLRPIEIRRYSTSGVCVSSGLEIGETVVGAGSQLVYPGRRVQAASMIVPTPRPQGGAPTPAPDTATDSATAGRDAP